MLSVKIAIGNNYFCLAVRVFFDLCYYVSLPCWDKRSSRVRNLLSENFLWVFLEPLAIGTRIVTQQLGAAILL